MNMDIHVATNEDIPAIVDLLKQSLGESLLPKSEKYWSWKHVDNPFGASPVLLAKEGEKLAGVRAFMRWRWKNGNRSVEAVRAVDTATHPDHQGKGIFSKLTRSLIDHCMQQGSDMIFNTPNEKSKPGYIKMGWQEAGRLPMNVRIVRPFSMGLNLLRKTRTAEEEKTDASLTYYLDHPGLPALVSRKDDDLFFTDHTSRSLRWRYADVPVVKYYACGVEEGSSLKGVLFYRLKDSRPGRELRVTDVFTDGTLSTHDIAKMIREGVRQHRADYITSSALSSVQALGDWRSIRNAGIGPVVTIRSLTMTDMSPFKGFTAWSPSTGDLELF